MGRVCVRRGGCCGEIGLGKCKLRRLCCATAVACGSTWSSVELVMLTSALEVLGKMSQLEPERETISRVFVLVIYFCFIFAAATVGPPKGNINVCQVPDTVDGVQ